MKIILEKTKKYNYLTGWIAILITLVILVGGWYFAIEMVDFRNELFYTEQFDRILNKKCEALSIDDEMTIPEKLLQEEVFTLQNQSIINGVLKKDKNGRCTFISPLNNEVGISQQIVFSNSVTATVIPGNKTQNK